MEIQKEKCNSCSLCVPYCPANAIRIENKTVIIDFKRCVECSACIKSGICKQNAFYQPLLEWPRILRAQFSDPLLYHPLTKIRGRGTAEVKTNDVSGRVVSGTVGLIAEVGRPGITASFADIEKITIALSKVVTFAKLNPISKLINISDGTLIDQKVKGERILSAIIECAVQEENVINVLKVLEKIAKEIDTVFSLGLIRKFDDNEKKFRHALSKKGFPAAGNGKVNIGLGRPMA